MEVTKQDIVKAWESEDLAPVPGFGFYPPKIRDIIDKKFEVTFSSIIIIGQEGAQ